MCCVHENYRKYVSTKNNECVLCVMLNSGLCGTLQGALLWCKLLRTKLINYSFKINPYDLFFANKELEGSQYTIIFHVDDAKISHKNPGALTDVINMLQTDFGKMVISRGKNIVF